MPFERLSELPDFVRKKSQKKQRTFMAAFNSALENYDPKKDKGFDKSKTRVQNQESFAFRIANAAISDEMKLTGALLAELKTAFPGNVPIISLIRPGILAPEDDQQRCMFCKEARPKKIRDVTEVSAGGYLGDVKKKKKRKRRMGEMIKGAMAGFGGVEDIVDRGLAQLQEQDKDMPFSTIERAVHRAVRAKFGPDIMAFPIEMFMDRVIVNLDGKLLEFPFTIDDETLDAALGKPQEVRVRFVPVGTP